MLAAEEFAMPAGIEPPARAAAPRGAYLAAAAGLLASLCTVRAAPAAAAAEGSGAYG